MKIERMEAAGIQVQDIDSAIALLSQALGLEFTKLKPGVDYELRDLQAGDAIDATPVTIGATIAIDAHGYLELVESPSEREGHRNIHFKVIDIDAAIAELRGRGVRLVRDVNAGSVREAIFDHRDTHGIRLCLVAYEGRSLLQALLN